MGRRSGRFCFLSSVARKRYPGAPPPTNVPAPVKERTRTAEKNPAPPRLSSTGTSSGPGGNIGFDEVMYVLSVRMSVSTRIAEAA